MPRLTAVVAFLCLGSALLPGQGSGAREKTSDYPACVAFDKQITLCGEVLARSIPVEGGVEFARNHLVVELGLLGPLTTQSLGSGRWSVKINGGKSHLFPDSPGMVVSSILYPDSDGASMTAYGSVDGRVLVVGKPNSRRPADVETRGPDIPRAPEPENRSGVQPEKKSLAEQLQRTSFPEGTAITPLGGLLFFRYSGKVAAIKRLDVYYTPPEGEAVVLKLLK